MSDPSVQTCPKCGTPFSAGAAFCDACGADLRAEVAKAAAHAEEKIHAEAAEVAEEKIHAEVAVSPILPAPDLRPATPTVVARPVPLDRSSARPAFDGAPPRPSPGPSAFDDVPMHADPADAVPFELYWDEARCFIEGVQCALSFRVRTACRIAKLGFRILVDDRPVCGDIVFSGLRAGDERRTMVPFVPRLPGQIVVKLRAEAVFDRGTHEWFSPTRDLEHSAEPFKRFLSAGDQNINIDIRDNNGIIRLDELKLPRQAIVDLKEEIERVLEKRDRYAPVEFSPDEIVRERAIVASSAGDGIRELLVLPGTGCVTFGMSSRADAQLRPETDGRMDDKRACFISGVHFSVQSNQFRGEFELRNGGPSSRDAKASWRPSTNGINVDGAPLQSSHRPLRAGETLSVVLAPYAVPGGSLSLTLEPLGWEDPAAASCDWRTGNLSSLLVRREDNPRKAILVVWGAAALDPLFGTETGLRVVSPDGRLYLLDRHGQATRFRRLAGRPFPGSPFTIS